MNSLNANLQKAVVIVKREYMASVYPSQQDRLFFCENGFGCYAFTQGSYITGYWVCGGDKDNIRGEMIECLAPEAFQSEFRRKRA